MSHIRRGPIAAAVLLILVALVGSTLIATGGPQSGSGGSAAGSPASRPDLEKWKDGGWQDWSPSRWLRAAEDFFNPVISGLWGPARMREAEDVSKNVDAGLAQGRGRDAGVTDPEPAPVPAQLEQTPRRQLASAVGKLFFDTPEGPALCSGTVVRDPAHPGRSNLVWTAGHCVHAGRSGGWFRNLVFVPDFNDAAAGARNGFGQPAGADVAAPFGTWWADGAQTSPQWIATGATTGGAGAPFDFAVLHVRPAPGFSRSLEEAVGAALPVDFNAPATPDIAAMGAWGYPADAPFDGSRMFRCVDRPGRLTLAAGQPTMYRIGCTMTGGSSGGGWFARTADGQISLVSNTSIGPDRPSWLAGPHLGLTARTVFESVSRSFANR